MATEIPIVKADIDAFGMINSIEYQDCEDKSLFERVGIRSFAITQTLTSEFLINQRKNWKRFGNAIGTSGVEKGVTMKSQDTVKILDPFSKEAQQTGSDKLIERFSKAINSKSEAEKQKASKEPPGFKDGSKK